MLPRLYEREKTGDEKARRDLVRVIELIERIEAKAAGVSKDSAFPASPATPGQAASIAAFERLRKGEQVLEAVWWQDYCALRAEGWDWRKAVYMAWASAPARDRWPATQDELATQCLGLTSDRTIRKWRAQNPEIEERIVKLQAEPLMRHRRDVLDALVTVASTADPRCHADRRMYLEIIGDYRASANMNVSMTPISIIELADDEEADDGA